MTTEEMPGERVPGWTRPAALLAINLLFLMVWGFAGVGKLVSGYPSSFDEVFGKTVLATVPGLRPSFYLLALVETGAALLALGALVRREFLPGRRPLFLAGTLVAGLFIFVMLGFGNWLTQEYTGSFQLFTYFAGNLVALAYLEGGGRAGGSGGAGAAA